MNLIIGGSSGLGRSITSSFAKNDKTYVVSRKKIETTEKNIISIQTDINDENLDLLYNSISENELSYIFFSVGLIDWEKDNIFLDKERSEKIFLTNFLSIQKIVSELIKKKKLKQDCLICFCSSVSTILPRHKQIFYCAAKNALNSYYKSLRSYLYVNKINYRVANLILGYMDTNMNKDIKLPFKKQNPDKIARSIFKNRKNLNGTYYFPKYWILIKIIINFLPEKILFKIMNFLKV